MAINDETVTPEELPLIQEEAEWREHLPALITDVIIRGGNDGKGAANFQARVLDARVRYLKKQIEEVISGDIGGVVLKGVLETEQELQAIPTEGLKVGTAYFVNFELRMWNGTEWASSGNLRGERGINVLGVWPNAVPLPEYTENNIGDAYIWSNDIWVLVPDFDYDDPNPEEELPPVWEALGIRGPQGASTYEIWKGLPGNEGKTEAQFIAAQKGQKGDPGEDAYKTWLTLPGNAGKSEEEWLEATKGEKGDKGDPRPAFKVAGGKSSVSQLPIPGNEQEAWYVDIDLYVWVEDDQSYFVVPGIKGKSAFEDWQTIPGNEDKTVEDFVEGLVSTVPGPKGYVEITGTVNNFSDLPLSPKDQDIYSVRVENALYAFIQGSGWNKLGEFRGANGANGLNVVLTGAVDTFDDLGDLPTVAEQDVYAVRDENTLYGRINSIWVKLGTFKGDKGDASTVPGPNGRNVVIKGAVVSFEELPKSGMVEQDAYSVWIENAVYMWINSAWVSLGKFRGDNGTNGKNGTNVIIKDSVNRFSDLPKTPTEQDVYSVIEENALYAWISDNWVLLGAFKGADGANGTNGINGINGTNGTNGKDGKSVDVIKILTEQDSTPPVADESTKGKAYIDLERIIWVNVNGDAWQDAGPFSGTPGEIGPQGPPMKPRGTVPTVADLPPLFEVEDGDLWFVADTKLGYAIVDGQWSAPIDIVGPEGKQGLEGLPGALMPILGLYPSMAALQAAHPTGAKGDAYLIVTGTESRDLVVWNVNTNAWQNTGPAGIVGPRGPKGEDSKVEGPKGERGSQWLLLPEDQDEPSNTFNGRAGDWAVTKNLRVWYKTVDRGWIFWNWIVAGDVNSPLKSLGKVVRFGDEWIPVPVDEVQGAVAGKLYGRKLKSGEGQEQTEWVEIIFPDVTTKDGKQYARVWGLDKTTPEWVEIKFPSSIDDPSDPEANALYLRRPSDKSWVKFVQAPTTAGLQYVQAGGGWVSFDRYDLIIKAISTTYAIDPTKENFVKLTNTTAVAKQISLANGPGSSRGMVVILEVVGLTGAVTYGGTNIKWDNNTIPALTGTRNLITFTWDGEVWIGAKGPTLTT